LAGKTSNLVRIIQNRRQSEAHNFETARLINKQIPVADVPFAKNALQHGASLEAIHHGVLMQPREKVGKL